MIDVSNRSKRSGLITETIAEWLNGDSKGKDAVVSLRRSIAYMMEDIGTLIELDYENLDKPSLSGVEELFSHFDRKIDMSREECAKYLIALAFIIVNKDIDYEEVLDDFRLHPRKKSVSPRTGNPPKKGALVGFDQPVGDLLTFRRALADGIKIGKKHVEGEDFDPIPNIVCIEANTKLYKEPTIERLWESADHSLWRDAYATNVDGGLTSEPEDDTISKEDGMKFLQMVIENNIDKRLGGKKFASDKEIRVTGAIPK